MSRTAIVVVAGLIVAGCVVAMLPAQESSRRKPSAYTPQIGQAAVPADPRDFLPQVPAAAGGGLATDLRAAGQVITNEFAAPAAGGGPAFAPAPDDPMPFQPPEDPTALQELPAAEAGASAPEQVMGGLSGAVPPETFAEPAQAQPPS